MNALATRLAVDDFAKGVGTTSILAGIYTAILMTDCLYWAILGPGAISFQPTTVNIRIAYVIRRTFAHGVAVRTGNANCSRMTRIYTAGLYGDALDVWYRVRSQTRRTLTNCSMIVSDANSVYATSILVAGVVTDVSEPVAELRRWTIDVIDARYCTTARRYVVGITDVEPGWALAVCHMIVDDAESVGAARDEVADRLTGKQAVRGAATRLVLRAFAVRGATIFAQTVTAATVIWIAGIAGEAFTTATVVFRDTARVHSTSEAAAERKAFEHTKSVRSTTLTGVAVVVADTVRYGWFLARRLHRVPLVAVLTFAGRVARYSVGLALLIGATYHFAAGVYAIVYTAFQFDTERAMLTLRVARAAGNH
jgi:hypothetical protein